MPDQNPLPTPAQPSDRSPPDTIWVGPHFDVEGLDWAAREVRLRIAGGFEATLAWREAATGELLRDLLGEGLSCDAWADRAAAAPDGGAEAQAVLERLGRGRLLIWWYGGADRRLLVAEPLHGSFAPAPPTGEGERRLSSKATILLAREAPRLVDPLVEAQIVVTADGLPLLPALASAAQRAAGRPALPGGLADFLARCGFLRAPGEEGSFAEAWTPVEWLFQRQTGSGTGPRFEFATTGERLVPPAGPRPAAPLEGRIVLPRDGLAGPDGRSSAPLAEVMERRRSLRRPPARPVGMPALAALLWSVARRRGDREARVKGDFVLRNVPGGGALGELEFYLAVERCDGLARGLYFYDGLEHALAPVAAPSPAFEAMMKDAGERLLPEDDARPDCLVVLSSRLARLAQKYRGRALRLSLLHVGLVYEALYLAATDLGLSPCANGFLDQALFARLTGLDPFEEVALGQFAISGPPD